MQLRTAPLQWRRIADIVGQQLVLNSAGFLIYQFDWVVSAVANSVLGAELLQRALREALPHRRLEVSRAGLFVLDGCCVVAGTWGLARQCRVRGRGARVP